MINDGLGNLSEESPVMAAARKLGGKGGEGTFFGMTAGGIIAGLVFSGIGYFYLKRGRDEGNTAKICCGVGMMLYPYFVSNTLYIVLIGAALMAVPDIMDRF